MKKQYKLNGLNNKTLFLNKIKNSIRDKKDKNLDIYIRIGIGKNADIKEKELDFDFDFKKDIAEQVVILGYRIHLFFQDVIFHGKVRFQGVQLATLEFKDVTFKESVAIKEVELNSLILRPYRIDGHIVVNIGKYAKKYKIVDCEKCYIKHITFEDPHVCNAKIYFVGINKATEADFRNRNLENVIFQNCNFQKTYFLNSFLKNSKFSNCDFPFIKNEVDKMFIGRNNILIFFVVACILAVGLIFYVPSIPELYILSCLSPFLIILIFIFYIMIESVLGIFLVNTLIGRHYGIYDEVDLKKNIKKTVLRKEFNDSYYETLSNIGSIYKDLKINFSNQGDMQKSGNFYYAANLCKIILSKNTIDTLILQGSYIINGFGERSLRSFFSIITILLLIVLFNTPNIGYIATPSTPSFLLQTNEKNVTCEEPYVEYNLSNFQKNIVTINYEDKKTYGFDNRFTYSKNPIFIPKLYDENGTKGAVVKIIYATSHIAMPFIKENRKWFQDTTRNSYLLSIVLSIILWIYLIGMFKAIFNRIKR